MRFFNIYATKIANTFYVEFTHRNYTKLNGNRNAIAQKNIKYSHTHTHTHPNNCTCLFLCTFCMPLKLAYLFHSYFFSVFCFVVVVVVSSFEGCSRRLLFGCIHCILCAAHTSSIFLLHLEKRRAVNRTSGPRSGSIARWPSLRIRNGTRARLIYTYIYLERRFTVAVCQMQQCAFV